MGFLGGLFEKKNCDVCGNKIGLLGNRKLEDGNLCKDCAAKLSPWFSERRHSTLAEIQQQLQYREANRTKVGLFNATRTIGKYYKVYIDDNKRQFMVTNAGKIADANPDVLDFSQITGCDLDVRENRSELKQKDKEGKSVSYNPPRFEYSYNFYCTIHVNTPYFDEMHFPLNAGAVRTGEQPMTQGYTGWNVSRNAGFGFGSGVNEYYNMINIGNEIKQAMDDAQRGGFMQQGMSEQELIAAAEAQRQQILDSMTGDQRRRVEQMQRIKQAIDSGASYEEIEAMQAEMEGAGAAAGFAGAGAVATGAADTVKMQAQSQVKCPWCGSMTSAESGKCQFCEGEL